MYSVGDIHGNLDALIALHDKIQQDAAGFSGDKIIVYLGDYIDRGMESRQVVDLLIKHPLSGFRAIHLRGNHDQVLLDFLGSENIAPQWFNFGGQATVLSYGVTLAGIPSGEKQIQLRKDLQDMIPVDHLSFFQQLEYSFSIGDYFFVHAGVRPRIALQRQSPMDMMWIREEFLNSPYRFDKMIVHGHSVVTEPEMLENRIAIDTGAYMTGRLTCLALESDRRWFLSTSQDE